MFPTPHRAPKLPRAGIDPIRDEATALAVIRMAAADPPRSEVILVLLDAERRGIALVVVSDTTDHDAVVEVAERILDAAVHEHRVGAAIIASCRPVDVVEDLADAERWIELDRLAGDAGIELVEWFVLGPSLGACGLTRPRELVNAPQRW